MRRSLIVLADTSNHTLMLFGAKSSQTGRFKLTERASCFGKFSSYVSFEKDLDHDDAIKNDVTKFLVKHIPFPTGNQSSVREKRQLTFTASHRSKKGIPVALER